MAKSSSFFGLRKGSTKSHTYQTYRGEQITKDRVSSVANPQSDGQMEQRLKLPIVAANRSVLRSLVNHSFEGVDYGYKSLYQFSSLNLKNGALTIKSYVPKGAMDVGVSNILLSRGSLEGLSVTPSIEQLENDSDIVKGVQIEDGDGLIEGEPTITTEPADDQTSYNQAVGALLSSKNLKEGDQVTFILLCKGDEYSFKKDSETELTNHYHGYVISRIILKKDDKDSLGAWKKFIIGDCYGITDGYIVFIYGTSGTTCRLGFALGPDSSYFEANKNGDSISSSNIEGAAVIVSRKVDDIYKRSTARITFVNVTDALSYDDVLYSYLKNKGASNKYLNSGTESVSIQGGNS